MATKEQIEYPVCDDCMLAAYDLCGNDKETQEELCREIGIEIADHTCITKEEPDLNETCECQCSRNKPRHPITVFGEPKPGKSVFGV